MAVNIADEGSGSLYWSAGIDTTNFAKDLDKIEQELQGLTQAVSKEAQKQEDLFKNVFLSPVEGIRKGSKEITDAVKANITVLKKQLGELENQSISLKGTVDTTPILTAITALHQQIDLLNQDIIDPKTGATNLASLNSGLTLLQEKIKALSTEAIQLKAADGDIAAVEKLQRLIGALQEQVAALNEKAATSFKMQQQAVEGVTASYDQSLSELQDYLAAIAEFNKQGINVPVNKRAQILTDTGKPPEQPVTAKIDIDEALLKRSQQTLAALDEETRLFVENLVSLENQISEVEAAQKELDSQFSKGAVSQKEYSRAAVALSAEEKKLRENLDDLLKAQKEYDRQLSSVGFINERKSALASLRNELASLSEAEIKDPNIGGKLRTEIAAVKKEIADLSNVASSEKSGLLENLTAQLKRFKTELGKAETPSAVAALNKQIEETQRKIAGLTLAGRTGFDEMGRPLREQEGILQRLQRQAEIYKRGIAEATLPENLAKYNLKLQETQEQLKRLSNAGKQGFDAQGNALKKSMSDIGDAFENAAAKSNLLGKAWGFLRQAAYFIPGLGIAGVVNLISDGVQKLIEKLMQGGSQIKTFEQQFKEAFAAIREEAIKTSAAEVSRLEVLRDVLADTTRNQKERISALHEYNSIAADNNKIDEKSLGNLNLINDKISEQITLLERRAITAAGEKLLGESAVELQLAQEKARAQALKEIENEDAASANLKMANAKKVDSYFEKLEFEGRVRRKIAANEDVKNAQAILEARRQALRASIDLGGGFTGTADGEAIKQAKESNDIGLKNNQLLEERRSLLEKLSGLQRDAQNSGLSKQASELDRINAKYDSFIQTIEKLNRKIEASNKLRGTNVDTIGKDVIDAVNRIRNLDIGNFNTKVDVENFKKNLEEQKNLFIQFEEAKKQIGLQKATELYQTQTGGFTSYLQRLKVEAAKLAPKLVFGIATDADKAKLEAITKEITEVQKKAAAENLKDQVQNIDRLMSITNSAAAKRLQVETQYAKDVESLQNNFSGQDLEQRMKALKDAKDEDLKDLATYLARQSSAYRKLNQDIVQFTRERIKQEIAALEKLLEKVGLDDTTKSAIKEVIAEWKTLDQSISTTGEGLEKFSQDSGRLADAFNSAASSVAGMNDELANSLRFVGSLLAGLKNVAAQKKAYDDAKDKSDTVGQISAGLGLVGAAAGVVGSVVSAISGIFKKAKQSRIDTENEIAAFNQRVLEGEMQITEEKRQQQREQVKLNKLKIQGLQDEKKLLEDQRKAVQDQYSEVLNQLAKQTAVIAEQPEKYGGFLGIGTKRRVKEITESLAGKSYEELEALFNKGQLVGKAKELFEMLQKLKQEGADIDQMLEDNKRAAAELFTGTTADTIVDSIADGFKRGLRSAADFASSFQDLMQQALIQSLKVRVLEGPIKELFDKFSDATQSGDQLTQTEIADLQSRYNQIIENAAKQFDQLQQIAGVNFSSSSSAAGSSNNTIQGSFKAITEDTANLLAGQFGGLRLTNVGILNVSTEQLSVARQQVEIMLESRAFARENMQTLQKIEINTAQAVRELAAQNEELAAQTRFWKDVTTGAKQIHMA